jgi:hypothetical protein
MVDAGPGWCWPSTDWVSFAGPGWLWPSSDVFVGQTDSGPSLMSGPNLAQTKKRDLLGRDRPNLFGAESGPVSGPTQPSPPSIIYYILYCFCIIYIFIDIYKKN